MAEIKFEIRVVDPADGFKPLIFAETINFSRTDVEQYVVRNAKHYEHLIAAGVDGAAADAISRKPKFLQDKIEAIFVLHKIMMTNYLMKLLFEVPEFADLKRDLPGLEHVDVAPFLK